MSDSPTPSKRHDDGSSSSHLYTRDQHDHTRRKTEEFVCVQDLDKLIQKRVLYDVFYLRAFHPNSPISLVMWINRPIVCDKKSPPQLPLLELMFQIPPEITNYYDTDVTFKE